MVFGSYQFIHYRCVLLSSKLLRLSNYIIQRNVFATLTRNRKLSFSESWIFASFQGIRRSSAIMLGSTEDTNSDDDLARDVSRHLAETFNFVNKHVFVLQLFSKSLPPRGIFRNAVAHTEPCRYINTTIKNSEKTDRNNDNYAWVR